MNFIIKLLMSMISKVDGWKAIMGYIIANIPAIVGSNNPLMVEAIKKALSDPSLPNVCEALGHILLTIGLLHKGIKNVKG